MNTAPVTMNGTKKKTKNGLNGGVPLFNHKNARDWIQRRATYDKNDWTFVEKYDLLVVTKLCNKCISKKQAKAYKMNENSL